jgi:hypothetical protein
MRARNLKPGFFKNDVLAECEPLARILFEGLWCMADREGRLECHPKRIKAEILPYDNCDIVKLIGQLRDKGFVTVYKIENDFYLEIPTFTQHQNCHIKEAESTIQAPCENDTCTVVVGPLTESLLLNPSYPLSRSGIKRIVPKIIKKDLFEQFWTTYPKKKSRGDAEKAWLKINPSEHLLATMIAKIEQAKTSIEWIKQTPEGGNYIPHPATWLNRKGWEDEYTQPASVAAELPEKKETRPIFTQNRDGSYWEMKTGRTVTKEEFEEIMNAWEREHPLTAPIHPEVQKTILRQAI